jgi:hypothetical protein
MELIPGGTEIEMNAFYSWMQLHHEVVLCREAMQYVLHSQNPLKDEELD